MVSSHLVSSLLLLASSVMIKGIYADATEQDHYEEAITSETDTSYHSFLTQEDKAISQTFVAQVGLPPQSISAATITSTGSIRVDPPSEGLQPIQQLKFDQELFRRQQGKGRPADSAAVSPAPTLPLGPFPTTLSQVAYSVSASLTSSAASALASVSASFQSQLGALSAQSSADVAAASAAVSSSASSEIASITASAASAIASVSASASSAISAANANTALLAVSASSAVLAASSSAAASAKSAIAAAQRGFATEVSTTTPSASASVNNNSLVQPNSSASSDNAGAFLVTPSQIAAIVIGTIVGTAILTLVVVYSVVLYRNRREKKFHDNFRKNNDEIAINDIEHDATGRAEGYSSRDEKQRANWPARLQPLVTARQVNLPSVLQKAQFISHRPSLPPLPEESPRVSGQADLSPASGVASHRFDYHALTYTPEQMSQGMPEEPAPVKLALTKRRSKGGSQRLAVTRVRSVGQQGYGTGSSSDQRNARKSANPYFSGPLIAGKIPFQRPAMVRTPSSDTIPHPNRGIPSPLALNPPMSASTAPRISAFTWGPWSPDSLVQPPQMPSLYQGQDTQFQPEHAYNIDGGQKATPQYMANRSQDDGGFLLQKDTSFPRAARQPKIHTRSSSLNKTCIKPYSCENSNSDTRPGPSAADYLPCPKPSGPANNLSISPVSPYSSTFENPLTSPIYVSPLSPPPKSPLRAIMRLSKSEYSLRERDISSPSSESEGAETPRQATPPLPLRRLSRSSGELRAVSLAQATAGLDLNIGPSGSIARAVPLPSSRFMARIDTNTRGVSVFSRASSSIESSHTNTNPNGGGRFTFLASSSHTSESNRSVTPTDSWSPPRPALKKRRSNSLGRIEIPPEQLTLGGIYVGAPGPRFTLFPRTDGGSGGSIPALAPVSPFGAGPGLGHGRSRSTGQVEYGQGSREKTGLGVGNI